MYLLLTIKNQISDDRNINDVQRADYRRRLNIISFVLSHAVSYYLHKLKMLCHSKNCEMTYCCRNSDVASYLGSTTPESDVRHPRCVSYNGKELRVEYAQSNTTILTSINNIMRLILCLTARILHV